MLVLVGVTLLLIIREAPKKRLEHALKINPWSAVENKSVFYRAFIIFIGIIVLFCLSNYLKIEMMVISVIGATLMLVLSGEDPDDIFESVDWSCVFFIAAFYVIVGGLEKAGVMELLAEKIAMLLSVKPEAAIATNILFCAISSALIDNIPVTLMIVSIAEDIAVKAGIPLNTLLWSTLAGVMLGGKITTFGSPSTIVGLGILGKEKIKVSLAEYAVKILPYVIVQIILVIAIFTLQALVF